MEVNHTPLFILRSSMVRPLHQALQSEVQVPLEGTSQALVHAGHWAAGESGCDIS